MSYRLSRQSLFSNKQFRSFFLSVCGRLSNLLKAVAGSGAAVYYLSPYYPLPDEGKPMTLEEQRSKQEVLDLSR